MDIITRFVNSGWNVKIEHFESKSGFKGVKIFADNGDGELIADGKNLAEAKKVLCLLNKIELPLPSQV
jgi:hypothetical protein